MKRSIFFCLILFIALSLSAQNSVSISGNVRHHDNHSISLRINDFDTDRMVGPGDAAYRTHHHDAKAEIWPDSSFTLTTDEITQAFTLCKLTFGRKTKEIMLSPGDSLVVDLDYWTFNSEIEFMGIGAERNNYWNDATRTSKEKEGKQIIGNLRNKTRIKERAKLMTEQLEFLEKFRADIDTAFYDWETKRIRYNCYDSNVRYSIWYNTRYSDHLDVTEPYDSVDLHDEEALLTIQSFRSLIKNYQKIHIAPQSSIPNGDMLLMFHLGNNNFSDLTRTYFLWTVIGGAINEAVDNKEKQLIWEFAYKNIQDLKTKNLLDGLAGNLRGGFVLGKSYSDSWMKIAIVLGVIFLFAIGLSYLNKYRYKRGKPSRLKNFSITRLFLILVFLCFNLYFFAEQGVDNIWDLLYPVAILVFIIIHTSIISRFVIRREFLIYSLSTALLLIGFYFAVFYGIKETIRSFDHSDIYDSVLPIFLITSVIMILFSFAYYYAGIVSRNRKGWSFLLDREILSFEALVHVLIISILIIVFASGMSKPNDLRSLMEIILGLLIFYVSAFFLTTKYLFEKKYKQFIIFSLLAFILFALSVTLLSSIFTYTRLHSRGLPFTFWETLELPHLDLFIFALPGAIYAYARKLLKDREKKGYSLFRQKEAELNQLRSQVNPHFLFNSLNTVYAFALKEGNEKTAETIAKLANLMRYLIDDMEKDQIPIKKEIGYIEDYIKLQLIRSSVDHNISINIDLDEEQQSDMIAPMLMIPFVENAFKHGINPNSISEFKLKVSFVNKQFQFVLENSVDKKFEAFYKEKGFGIGIENVRKRLEFIYPDKHTLSIADTHDRFIVIMNIQLEKQLNLKPE